MGWQSATNPLELLLIRAIMLVAIIGLICFAEKHKSSFIFLLRQTYALILSGYFYSETVFYNKLIFNNIDPLLEKIEYYVFGMQVSVQFSEIITNKLFSELMYLSYFSFYLLIASFTLLLFFKSKNTFAKAVFQLSASLYIFYIIFAVFPSAGPQFYFLFPENSLPDAYLFDNIMHFIQKVAEQPTAAFPSSHVGVSVIILILSRKILPKFYIFILPIVFLLTLSTVYIKAHYAIDVIAAILIAPIVLYWSNILYRIIPNKSMFEKVKIK